MGQMMLRIPLISRPENWTSGHSGQYVIFDLKPYPA